MRRDLLVIFSTNFPELKVGEEHWVPLSRGCRIQKLAKHNALFRQGEGVAALYAVIRGEVALQFTTLDGHSSVVEHVSRTQLFGLASFASGRRSTYEAVATRASQVLAIDEVAYVYLMDRVPGFARALMRELARRHHHALELLEATRHSSALERLSLALAKLVQSGRARERDQRGRVLVYTTQAELAALANLSRQTTNGLIGELRRQGRVEPVYGGLWVASSGG
jgi:CRP-like cAMP-binding protein